MAAGLGLWSEFRPREYREPAFGNCGKISSVIFNVQVGPKRAGCQIAMSLFVKMADILQISGGSKAVGRLGIASGFRKMFAP